MKTIWILEGWITPEEMNRSLKEIEAMRDMLRERGEDSAVAEEWVERRKRSIAKHPEGYWLGYQGKLNYRDFCYEARMTMQNMDCKMKWRVLKAQIPEDAKTWPNQYVNGVENAGVLRYLYATKYNV